MAVCTNTMGIFVSPVAVLLISCFATIHTVEVQAQSAHGEARHSAAKQRSYIPAAVHARPGLSCKLVPKGRPNSEGLPVYTDDDGYARFFAVRTAVGSRDRHQILDCADDHGNDSSFPVDLASEDTFAPHPLDISRERGKARPALSGDPFAYSEAELLKAGYGLRPNPEHDSAGYLSWLLAASMSGRMLEAKRPNHRKHSPIITQAPGWTGSVLTGAPDYLAVQGMFNVPLAIPGGDQTTYTKLSVWNGLGGFFGQSGLIQSGVDMATTPTSAGYVSFREYCCGDPNSNGYGGDFVPNPGDVIYVENWYCDAEGRVDLNGGYGCSFLHDLNTSAILNCSLAKGSPCWSVQALPLCSTSPTAPNCMAPGVSAEFIAENASPQANPPSTAFMDFSPRILMTGSSRSSSVSGPNPNTYSQTISSDPTVFLLTDFTNTTTQLQVTLGTQDSTCFTIHARTAGGILRWPPVDCPATLLGSIPFDPGRRDELVALILYGIIQDGGGVYILGGTVNKVPPRGPVTETLAALPSELAKQLAPLLRELPHDSDSANQLAKQLSSVISSYRKENFSRQLRP